MLGIRIVITIAGVYIIFAGVLLLAYAQQVVSTGRVLIKS